MRQLEEKKREMLTLERALETEMRLSGRSVKKAPDPAAEATSSRAERIRAKPNAVEVSFPPPRPPCTPPLCPTQSDPPELNASSNVVEQASYPRQHELSERPALEVLPVSPAQRIMANREGKGGVRASWERVSTSCAPLSLTLCAPLSGGETLTALHRAGLFTGGRGKGDAGGDRDEGADCGGEGEGALDGLHPTGVSERPPRRVLLQGTSHPPTLPPSHP